MVSAQLSLELLLHCGMHDDHEQCVCGGGALCIVDYPTNRLFTPHKECRNCASNAWNF